MSYDCHGTQKYRSSVWGHSFQRERSRPVHGRKAEAFVFCQYRHVHIKSGTEKEIPENTFFHMTDLADKLLAENRRVGMYPISEDSFLDMGEFEEMHRMEEKLNLKSE